MTLEDRIKKLEVSIPADDDKPDVIEIADEDRGLVMAIFPAYRKGRKWVYGKSVNRLEGETEADFLARVETERKKFKGASE